MTIPAGATIVAPLFVNANEFQGKSTSVDEGADTTTITFESATFTAGEFDEADYPLYYAESIGGDDEGFGYDIISNDSDSITVAGLISDQGLAVEQVFAIRKHVTLGQFFDGASGLSLTDSSKFFLSDGSVKVFIWNGSKWFGSTDGDIYPIYPGTGFLATLKATVEITTTGTVKNTATQVPVVPTSVSPSAINLVASGSPVDETLGGLSIAGDVGLTGSVKFFEPGTLLSGGVLISSGSAFVGGEGDGTIVYPGEGVLVTVKSSSNFLSLPAAYTE